MPFTTNHYLRQAAELEALAEQTGDSAVRIDHLELAQRFRDMANLAGVAQTESDEEAVRLAERMVGKVSGTQSASFKNSDKAKE
jgi:hypothetical protein